MSEKIISGKNEDEVWEKIKKELVANPDLLDYRVTIKQQKRKILLDIDIDLGGGFESGYSTTTLLALLQNEQDFRFAIHKEDFFDEVGKFFGMQDVEIGYPEFDKKLIIKTNDKAKVKAVFSDRDYHHAFRSRVAPFCFAPPFMRTTTPARRNRFQHDVEVIAPK